MMYFEKIYLPGIARCHGKLCITKLQTGPNIWLPGECLGFGHTSVWSNPTYFTSSWALYLELHVCGGENGQDHCQKRMTKLRHKFRCNPGNSIETWSSFSYISLWLLFYNHYSSVRNHESLKGDGNSWKI